MKQVKAFLLGIKEFRSSFTTRFEGGLAENYDWGREIAHLVTFRKFED